jgi:hypothetical protein
MNANNTNDKVKYQNKHNHSIDNNLNHLPKVVNSSDNSLLSCMKVRNVVVILGLPTMITAKVLIKMK